MDKQTEAVARWLYNEYWHQPEEWVNENEIKRDMFRRQAQALTPILIAAKEALTEVCEMGMPKNQFLYCYEAKAKLDSILGGDNG